MDYRELIIRMSNPCQTHDYEPMIVPLGKATIVQQICKQCFDIQGWIYDWFDPEYPQSDSN